MEMELELSQHWGYPVSMSNPEIHHQKHRIYVRVRISETHNSLFLNSPSGTYHLFDAPGNC